MRPQNRNQLRKFLTENIGLKLVVTRTRTKTVDGQEVILKSEGPADRAICRVTSSHFYMTGPSFHGPIYTEQEPGDFPFRHHPKETWEFTQEFFACSWPVGACEVDRQTCRLEYRYVDSAQEVA